MLYYILLLPINHTFYSINKYAANVKVTTVLGSIPASGWQRGIWGAIDEAVLNKVLEKIPKIPLKTKQFVAEVTADPAQKMDWEQMVQVSRSDGHFSTGQSTRQLSLGF